jgi:hypothetical protein
MVRLHHSFLKTYTKDETQVTRRNVCSDHRAEQHPRNYNPVSFPKLKDQRPLLISKSRPETLLSTPTRQDLKPYSTLTVSEPIYSTAPYPYFNLSDTSTTLLLHSKRDSPIHLTNALSHETGIWASYPLQNTTTEAWISPYSLAFTPDGQHFVAGGQSLLAVFDVSRNGQGPIERHKTGFKTKGHRNLSNVTGSKALISTLDINCDSVLALGTYNRTVALYSNSGRGEAITSFSMKDVERNGDETMGWGISQVKWSQDGRYLLVAERRSEGISIYDIRGTGKRLGWLAGRNAQTNIKLGFDILTTGDGLEVWAGTMDGMVIMWKDPTWKGGVSTPDAEWKVHDDPVCATLVHPSGSVVVTASIYERIASWREYESSSSEDSFDDSSDDSSDSGEAISISSDSDSSQDRNDDQEEHEQDVPAELELEEENDWNSMLKVWSFV